MTSSSLYDTDFEVENNCDKFHLQFWTPVILDEQKHKDKTHSQTDRIVLQK